MSVGIPILLAILAVVAVGSWFLARPVVLAVARHRSGDLQLRISARASLAVLRRVDTVVLDAKGTITTGELRVVAVEPLDPEHDRNLRWFAGALQHVADDPVAQAIARLSTRGQVTDVQVIDGAGITGSVDRHPVRVGRPEWIGLEDAPTDRGLGRTVGVEVDGRALGRITVADTVRPQAPDAVVTLRGEGLELVMATDEDSGEARNISGQAGIDQVHADTDESSRARLVEGLRTAGRVVAFVGRSTGNTAAHAAADVAISDDVSRAPVTLTTRDVAVHHVVRVVRLARNLPGVVRAVRVGPIVVCVIAAPAIALTRVDVAVPIAVGAVALSAVAVVVPILRWRS